MATRSGTKLRIGVVLGLSPGLLLGLSLGLLLAAPQIVGASGTQERPGNTNSEVYNEAYNPDIAGGAGLRGRVVDGFGQPAPARLQLCGDVCWPATTDANGDFHIADVPPAIYTLRTTDNADEPLCTAPPIELELIASHTIDLTAPVILSECLEFPS